MLTLAFDGDFELTQPWGNTDVTAEPHDDRFPDWLYCHQGHDYACPPRTPVRAIAEGVVTFEDSMGELRVTYDNLGGIRRDSWMFHLDEIVAPLGSRFTRGTVLAFTGNRGNSTGPHLHIEISDGAELLYGNAYLGRPYHSIDPTPYLTPPQEVPEVLDTTDPVVVEMLARLKSIDDQVTQTVRPQEQYLIDRLAEIETAVQAIGSHPLVQGAPDTQLLTLVQGLDANVKQIRSKFA